MKILIRKKNFWIMLAGDCGLIVLSYYLACLLRFGGQIPAPYLDVFKQTLLLVAVVKIGCFFFFNLYRGMWRCSIWANTISTRWRLNAGSGLLTST